MDRRRAWRQWRLCAAITTIALIVVAVLTATALPQLGWWVVALTGFGAAAVVIGVVANRPRPFTGNRGPGRGTDLHTACKSVRRGIRVDPVDRRLEAIDVIRREWYSVSVTACIWPVLAVNWAQQIFASSDSLGGFSVHMAIFGSLMLLISIAAVGYYGRVLKRLDSLEESTTPV